MEPLLLYQWTFFFFLESNLRRCSPWSYSSESVFRSLQVAETEKLGLHYSLRRDALHCWIWCPWAAFQRFAFLHDWDPLYVSNRQLCDLDSLANLPFSMLHCYFPIVPRPTLFVIYHGHNLPYHLKVGKFLLPLPKLFKLRWLISGYV